jgi:HD-GYP domain-containing protein (c-di-GMP phosphodiesterase class II)
MMHVFVLEKSVPPATTKDGYTAEHAAEVARLSRMVGLDLGFNEEGLEWLVHGALLHDLGKLGVADEILGKPGTLTEEEWAAVKRHPQIGARMIEPIEPFFGAVPVVRHHHERPDGTGYPDGLEGEEIPLAARVVAAADAYDVMVRGRPYRPKSSPAQALQELWREAGRQFDARVVEALGRLLGDAKGHVSLQVGGRLLLPGRTPRCTLCPSSWPGRLSRELFTPVRRRGILRSWLAHRFMLDSSVLARV